MLRLLATLLRESDAPASQYQRLGIPFDGEPGPEHLLVANQADRAAATAEPLAPITDPDAATLLNLPVVGCCSSQAPGQSSNVTSPGWCTPSWSPCRPS